MMDLVRTVITHVSPIFLVTSPVTSYADQIHSIYRSRSSAGFSLDLPLIMLMASIAKIFFWFGEHYETALFVQACLTVVVQTVLLYVALSNRAVPNPAKDLSNPFAGVKNGGMRGGTRPYDFWQWRATRPYWQFLVYYAGTLLMLQVLLGTSQLYVSTLGSLALTVEATVPLPQIYANHMNRSCKGFRLSVLSNWLIGDVLKMSFFFLSDSPVPWAFKACGLFQFACDTYLGVQYARFGEGSQDLTGLAAGV